MGWHRGQTVRLVQGGETLREARVVDVTLRGRAILDSGNHFREDGTPTNPDMHHSGIKIKPLETG